MTVDVLHARLLTRNLRRNRTGDFDFPSSLSSFFRKKYFRYLLFAAGKEV